MSGKKRISSKKIGKKKENKRIGKEVKDDDVKWAQECRSEKEKKKI